MGYQDQQQPPSNNRGLFWIGVIGAIGFLTIVCAVSVFFLYRQFQTRTAVAPRPTLILPTSSAEETAETQNEISTAPTVTLGSEEEGESNAPPASQDSNVVAFELTSRPNIDGDLSEWSTAQTYVSAFRVYNVSSWSGTADLTAVWRLGWDSNHLFIAVDVNDDTHVQIETGNLIYRGDSVDMQFDTNRDGDYASELSPDDFQITFSPGNFGNLPPSAFRFRGTVDGAILDAPGGHNIILAAQQKEDGYTLEAAIPWSDLEVIPRKDLVIGVALNANDNDTVNTAVQEVMMSHISTRRLTDPTTWGTLTLK